MTFRFRLVNFYRKYIRWGLPNLLEYLSKKNDLIRNILLLGILLSLNKEFITNLLKTWM